MAEGLKETYPAVYSVEQLDCLELSYAGLDAQKLELLSQAALFPGGEANESAVPILVALFEGCDAPLPPDLAEASEANLCRNYRGARARRNPRCTPAAQLS